MKSPSRVSSSSIIKNAALVILVVAIAMIPGSVSATDEVIVALINRAAPKSSCSPEESAAIHRGLLQPINLALQKYGFHTITESHSNTSDDEDAEEDKGEGPGDRRELNFCDSCPDHFSSGFCITYYNCHYRIRTRKVLSFPRLRGNNNEEEEQEEVEKVPGGGAVNEERALGGDRNVDGFGTEWKATCQSLIQAVIRHGQGGGGAFSEACYETLMEAECIVKALN